MGTARTCLSRPSSSRTSRLAASPREALPQAGWAQIVALIAILDNSLFAQDPDLAPGDVVGKKIPWVRYSDPVVKEFKLNAERNNGRAAMMGITGMIVHNLVGVDSLYPIVQ